MAERPTPTERVLGAIDDDRLERLLQELLEQYSPTWAEEPAIEVIAAAFNEAGLPYLRQPVPAGDSAEQRGNLVVELGDDPPALTWVGHVDTVPALDEEQLAPRREGDRLFGLGAADMKGACAAMAEALIALVSCGVEPSRGFSAAFVVGEEEEGDGSRALIERSCAPVTVIGEPTGLAVSTDHFGYFEHRLHCTGDTVHAALPELGSSAIRAMLSWITALYESAAGAFPEDQFAVNLREIEGGGDLFAVPAHCSALVDIHAAPAISGEDIVNWLTVARRAAAESFPSCGFSSDALLAATGYRLDEGDSRFAPLRRAFERSGLPWRKAPFRSHSDAHLFRDAGSLPVICGPGRLEVAHTRHEHVSLAEVRQAARLYAAMLCECCAS